MAVKKTKENSIEMYTRWYWEELMEHGYISKIEREPETLVCADPLVHYKTKRLTSKPPKVITFNLLPKIVLTYDTKVVWTEKARYIFYDVIDRDMVHDVFKFDRPPFIANKDYDEPGNEIIVTRVDTKPPSKAGQMGAKLSSSYTFPIKQRMIMDKHGIYVDKFVPIPMSGSGITIAKFPNTFTPRRYLFTDREGSTQLRKINWNIPATKTKPLRKVPPISLDQFVRERLRFLEENQIKLGL